LATPHAQPPHLGPSNRSVLPLGDFLNGSVLLRHDLKHENTVV
jgi:hypothetical protein